MALSPIKRIKAKTPFGSKVATPGYSLASPKPGSSTWAILEADPFEARESHQSERVQAKAPAKASYVINGKAVRPGKSAFLVYDLYEASEKSPAGSSGRKTAPLAPHLMRSVLETAVHSLEKFTRQPAVELTTEQFVLHVAETMVDEAIAKTVEVDAPDGWQQLLERGLRAKAALLTSPTFKSTTEAGKLLAIGEPAIRKRVRERKLFALRMPGDGDLRIPAWALDPRIAGPSTTALLDEARDADEWQVYHFMATPNGSLNGLRPFECLLSEENLTPAVLNARSELNAYLKRPANASLLSTVKTALASELAA